MQLSSFCRALLFACLLFHCCMLVLADPATANDGSLGPGATECRDHDKRDKICTITTLTVVSFVGNPPPTAIVTVVQINPTSLETVVFPMTTATLVRTSSTPLAITTVVSSEGRRGSGVDKIAIAMGVLIFLTFLVIV